MRLLISLCFLFVFAFGCNQTVQPDANLFEITMQRRNLVGPCGVYNVKIENDGKVIAERTCIFFYDCENSESNGVTVEKRRCSRNETEKLEKQLTADEIKDLRTKVEEINFFSFKDDYGLDLKNCSQITSDSPVVVLTIKTKEKEKTIRHDYGCWVNNWLGKENALQPLKDLENKINRTIGIESWTTGKK